MFPLDWEFFCRCGSTSVLCGFSIVTKGGLELYLRAEGVDTVLLGMVTSANQEEQFADFSEISSLQQMTLTFSHGCMGPGRKPESCFTKMLPGFLLLFFQKRGKKSV